MSYAERALRTLSAGNRTLLRAEDEQRLLSEMCRVIVEPGGYRMAWVGFAEHDEQKTIRPVAHYGFEAGYFDLARFTWADGERGPTSEAVRTGRPTVLQDVRTLVSPHLAVPLSETLRQGYAAAAAFPLISDGRVIGNLTILAAEQDAFDEQEVALLGELAEDLAYGIGTLRMRARQRAAEETIRQMAYFDSLTSLPNRTSMQQELTDAIEEMQVAHNPLAMLMIKIGHFQEIGDTLGYLEADLLVLEISRRLSQFASAGRSVARIAEDEFGLVLRSTGAEVALRLAQRIMSEICDLVPVGGLSLDPHAVVGIAMYPGHGTTADVIMRRARVAAVQARHTPEKIALYIGTVDQFGTGYSSLSYLQRLPVDALKVDQSFVASMLTNAGSATIVRSTVELGHNLGLGVIAEGVESEAQWEGLLALGCDTVQGYFIGRPIPVEHFIEWEEHSRWHGQSPDSHEGPPDA